MSNFRNWILLAFIVGVAIYIFYPGKSVEKITQLSSDKASYPTIDIDLINQHDDNISFDSVFQVVDVIPFERKGRESSLHSVRKMFIDSGRYYLVDSELKVIAVFSPNGKFLENIGSFGEDSSQYLDITDCDFDALQKELTIYSTASKGILTYKMNGDFMSYRELPFYGSYFAKMGTGHIFFLNNNFNEYTGYNNIISTDSSGKVIANAWHTDVHERPGISFSGYLGRFDDGVLASLPFSDTIFQFANGGYYPRYAFKMGDCTFKSFNSIPQNKINGEILKHCYVQDGYIDNRDVFCFSYFDAERRTVSQGFYFKADSRLVTSRQFHNSSLIRYLTVPKLVDNGVIYAFFNTELFFAEKDRSKLLQEIRRYAPSLSGRLDTMSKVAARNPILIAYRRRPAKPLGANESFSYRAHQNLPH